MSQWSRATVNIDYHIAFDGNFYSVPYTLVQQVWKFAPPRPRSRSFIKATGSLPAGEVKPSPRMSTVPKVIRPICNGRQVDVDFARHRIAWDWRSVERVPDVAGYCPLNVPRFDHADHGSDKFMKQKRSFPLPALRRHRKLRYAAPEIVSPLHSVRA
jgi:hypothetical protein